MPLILPPPGPSSHSNCEHLSQRGSPGQARGPDHVAARYLGIKAYGSYPRIASEQTRRTLVIIRATIGTWAVVSSR